jgi:phosphatidylserine/phosphatidylglycerophosphate/cardiolipin synthase-like enzyme
MLTPEVIFTRNDSVATVIGRLIEQTAISMDAALYRFNNPNLVTAISECIRRGVSIRLVLDFQKFQNDFKTRELLAIGHFPFRVLSGPQGKGKMHHKFAILDNRIAISGSYNWTLESEEENYENLVILRNPQAVAFYCHEFELLWKEAASASKHAGFPHDL